MSIANGSGPEHRPDPLIDDVREARRRLCERYGNDVDRFAAALRREQEKYPERLGFTGPPGARPAENGPAR